MPTIMKEGKIMDKNKKQYLKDIKDTKAELKQIVKEWKPWDWSFAMDLFITSIEWMKKYYACSYNVVAQEEPRMPTRLEMCDIILNSYYEYLSCVDLRCEQALFDKFMDNVKKYLIFLWD